MTPFVKWAGGKGQLIGRLLKRMPKEFNRYYEPFVGGGALLMAARPKQACINDVNRSLINAYEVIRDDSEFLIWTLADMDMVECTRERYMAYRDEYNRRLKAGVYDCYTAALFIFLNKHCFNGLYRVNSEGAFNVPWNNKSSGRSMSPENIEELSVFLKGIDIKCGDFEAAVQDAQAGDFVFFDSPYVPLNSTSFESYTKNKFSEQEHRRLAALFRKLTERSCLCMATNHDTELVRDLYADYHIETTSVRRAINSDGKKRIGTEVIICNYDVEEVAVSEDVTQAA